MKLLRDFPVIRIRSSEHPELPDAGGFLDALPIPENSPGQLAEAANRTGEETVVLIDPHVTPASEIEVFEVEPLFLDARLCLLLPARSLVTGLIVPRGVRVVPVSSIDEQERLVAPSLTLPRLSGSFSANEAPSLAFCTAYDLSKGHSRHSDRQASHQLALSASLGIDALNGHWWVLGALYGLLGHLTVEEAWADCIAGGTDPDRKVRVLAREVRIETGLAARALDVDQSIAIKAMLPDAIPNDIWGQFVAACADLGADGKAVAERYARAATLK